MTLLKDRAQNKGVTQIELSEIAGVSDAHINYVLNGKRDISYSLAKKIYKVLDYKSPLPVILNFYNIEVDQETEELLPDESDNVINEMTGEYIIKKFRNTPSRTDRNTYISMVFAILKAYQDNYFTPDVVETWIQN